MNLRTRLERLQRTAKDHQRGHEAGEVLRAAIQRGRARIDAWRRAEAINAGALVEHERNREIDRLCRLRLDSDPAVIAARQSGDIVSMLKAGHFRRAVIRAQMRGEVGGLA